MQSKDTVAFAGITADEFEELAGIAFDEAIALAVPKAQEALKHAYAPYSGFQVGAALLAQGGKIFTGANVENASFGLAICAERTAATAAVCGGTRDFRAIVVLGSPGAATSPCGACRQFLSEFNRRMPVVYAAAEGFVVTTLDRLLPDSFGPAALEP